jgi:hypothetical protein
MRRRLRYPVTALTVIAVTLAAVLSACSAPGTAARTAGPGQALPSATAASPAGNAAGCQVRRGDIVSASDMPGYTQFVGYPNMALPVKSRIGFPLWFQRDYLCGELYGFITNVALTGPYRQQNNARARQLHYPIQKYPYVPLTGSIVSGLPHNVLEVYEAVYQFSAAKAATAFLQLTSQGSLLPRTLTIAGLPHGTIVIQHSLGLQPNVDESAIFVGVHIGDYAITVSFQGGRSLDWADVQPYWHALAAVLP